MIIYFLIIAYLLYCSFIFDYNGITQKRRIYELFAIFFLIALAGLRYHIGTDSAYYELEFSTFPKVNELNSQFFEESRYAPLYVILTSIIRTITAEFWVFQLILSIFLNSVVYYTIKRYTNNRIAFSFLLMYFCSLYYNLNCEVLRESIAVGFFLISIQHLLAKEWKRYYIYVAIATLFHYGAIYLVIVPLFMNLKINRKFIIVFSLLILCYPVLRVFKMDNFLTSYLQFTIFGEVSGNYVTEGVNVDTVGFSTILTQLIMPFFFCIYLKKNMDHYFLDKIEPLLIVYLFTMWLSIIFIPAFIRFNDYFSFFYYIYYSYTILVLSKKIMGKSSPIFWLFLFLPYTYTCYNSWTNSYIKERLSNSKRIELIDPYTSIFTKETISSRERIYQELYKN